jgi:hypothetical protein
MVYSFRLMVAAGSAYRSVFRGWRRSPRLGAAPVLSSPAKAVIGPETNNVQEARCRTSRYRAQRRSFFHPLT